MNIAVLIGAILMGLSLGLLGSGGSILTVPVLVYLAGEPEKQAIAESLIIVAMVAAVGAWCNMRKQNTDIALALRFGIPSMFAAVAGAWASQFVSGAVQLLVFSIVMLTAAIFMLRGSKKEEVGQDTSAPGASALKGIISGSGVGAMAGFVGVGGGFLIVPVLLNVMKIRLSMAVGTSLMIICMQSVAAALKYQHQFAAVDVTINWPLVLVVGGVAILGVLAGGKLGQSLPQAAIKKGFAFLLLAIGLFTAVDAGMSFLRTMA
ncbi:sulfite exporter TauE/SafE family protein [Aestuariibacter salexigens]|uniref:sulfite exporter TauE/SafE family protein n=1 Tax=Aestuariibacter salexigens TaxID=226010 RepID=UPI0004223DAB|nr:sulfite exporter TauE/SafE family protein [Aestuariibacter salexigens]